MKKLMLKKILPVVLLLMLTIGFTTPAYSQCAMCRASVESNVGTGGADGSNSVGSGLNMGILYLMVIPYVLIGTVGFLWYRSNKKKKEAAIDQLS